MNTLIEAAIMSVVILTWLMGTAIAQGFWQTTFAVLLPPYAWYLLVERAMKVWGLL